jgi:hypothetical protein
LTVVLDDDAGRQPTRKESAMRNLGRLRIAALAFGSTLLLTACPEDPGLDDPLIDDPVEEDHVDEPADDGIGY